MNIPLIGVSYFYILHVLCAFYHLQISKMHQASTKRDTRNYVYVKASKSIRR